VYLVDRLHKIVLACQENKPAAQQELYDMFKSKMFAICLRYAGNYDDAQDILQEGFLKVFEKIRQFGFKGAFEGWIRRIVVNTALEKFRNKHNLYRVDDIDLIPEPDAAPETEDYSGLEAVDLLDIIRELPPKYRMVFNLFAIEGYSHKEISEMINISEGTSKSNLSRARVILQKKVNLYTGLKKNVVIG